VAVVTTGSPHLRLALPPWPPGAGYIVKQKDGRRNRYQIQAHLPLPEPSSRERTLGEVLALLADDNAPP
jgi:hypothetical protein